MFIFLTIVMGPGLGFMLYALSQFWREARRFATCRFEDAQRGCDRRHRDQSRR